MRVIHIGALAGYWEHFTPLFAQLNCQVQFEPLSGGPSSFISPLRGRKPISDNENSDRLALAECLSEEIFTKSQFDLLHLHYTFGTEALLGAGSNFSKLVSLLAAARKNKVKVLHQLHEPVGAAQLLESGIIGGADIVLKSRADCASAGACIEEWFSVPSSVTFIPEFAGDLVNPSSPIAPAPQQVRVTAFIDSKDDQLGSRIEQIFGGLKERGLKYISTLVPFDSLTSWSALCQCISQTDIVVEHGDGTPYGVTAINALALGKTVLSGTAPPCRADSDQARLTPILKTDLENLGRRIESLVKEPKALRDLNKRSKLFAHKFHDPVLQIKELVQIYQGLISGVVARQATRVS